MSEIGSTAEHVVLRKVGPLPVIAYVVIGAGGLLLWRRLHPAPPSRAKASAHAVPDPSTLSMMDPFGPSDMSDFSGTLLNTLQSLDSRFAAEQAVPKPAMPIGDDPQSQVTSWYREYLGRDPEPSGLQFWENALSRYGPTQTQRYFATSDEAAQRQVNRLSWMYLGRAPGDSLTAWKGWYQNDPEDFQRALAASAEHVTYAEQHPKWGLVDPDSMMVGQPPVTT